MARALRDLPLPDSPTMAIVSPRSSRRSTPATSVLPRRAGDDLELEALDVEKGCLARDH